MGDSAHCLALLSHFLHCFFDFFFCNLSGLAIQSFLSHQLPGDQGKRDHREKAHFDLDGEDSGYNHPVWVLGQDLWVRRFAD